MDAAVFSRRAGAIYAALAGGIALVVMVVAALVGLGAIWSVLIGLVAGVGLAALLYSRSDAMVLNAIGARPLTPGELPSFEKLVEGLVVGNGFRMPKLYLIDDSAPNAMAIGRQASASSLVVTSGLVSGLRRIELEGVIAHELSRVRARESALGLATGTVVGHLPAALAAPLAQRLLDGASVVHADIAGVGLTRYPPGLANGLAAIARDGRIVKHNPRAYRHLWVAAPPDALIEQEFPLSSRIDLLHEL